MRKQLHVALVYNIRPESDYSLTDKKEIMDDGSNDVEGHRGNNGGQVVVASRTIVEKTKGDTYAEWDSEKTILAVESALKQHHHVTLIEADEEAHQKLLAVQPDIVFNIAEGLSGPSREAQIPAILEMLGIPYTGSDPVTLGICLDKSRTKEILSYYNIPTPLFAVVHSMDDIASCAVSFPAIVKPLHEGSSKGIFDSSIVHTTKELTARVEEILLGYGEPALVEQFLPGREFTVAFIGNGADVRALPLVEIRFDSLPKGVNPIYSYEAKWIWDQVDHPIDVHECPARIDKALEDRIVAICRKAYDVLRCRDWCRIDVRLDDRGEPQIIELNPLPGILPDPEEHSCFPQAARAAGMEYNAMINAVLKAAIARCGVA